MTNDTIANKIYQKLLEIYAGKEDLRSTSDEADIQKAGATASAVKTYFGGNLSKEELQTLFRDRLSNIKQISINPYLSILLYNNITSHKIITASFLNPNSRLRESIRKSSNYKIINRSSVNFSNYCYLAEEGNTEVSADNFNQISADIKNPVLKDEDTGLVYVSTDQNSDTSRYITLVPVGLYGKYLTSKTRQPEGIANEESIKLREFADSNIQRISQAVLTDASAMLKRDPAALEMAKELLTNISSYPLLLDSNRFGVIDSINILSRIKGTPSSATTSKSAALCLKASSYSNAASLIKTDPVKPLPPEILNDIKNKLNEIINIPSYINNEIIILQQEAQKRSTTTASQKFKGSINNIAAVFSLILKQFAAGIGVRSDVNPLIPLMNSSTEDKISYCYNKLLSTDETYKTDQRFGAMPFIQVIVTSTDNYPLLLESAVLSRNKDGHYISLVKEKKAGISKFLDMYIRRKLQRKKLENTTEYLKTYEALRTNPDATIYAGYDPGALLTSLVHQFYSPTGINRETNSFIQKIGKQKIIYFDCPYFLKDVKNLNFMTSDMPISNASSYLDGVYSRELGQEHNSDDTIRAIDLFFEQTKNPNSSGELSVAVKSRSPKELKKAVNDFKAAHNFRSLKDIYIEYMNILSVNSDPDYITTELGPKITNIINNIKRGFWTCDQVNDDFGLGIFNPYSNQEKEPIQYRLLDSWFTDVYNDTFNFILKSKKEINKDAIEKEDDEQSIIADLLYNKQKQKRAEEELENLTSDELKHIPLKYREEEDES